MCSGKDVLLGVGSNLGDKLAHIIKAFDYINTNERLSFIDTASIYVSQAEGFTGEDFYNTVWYLKANIEPHELLNEIKAIENKMGRIQRKSGEPFKSRPIDLDILFFEGEKLETMSLEVPHKEFYKRSYTVNPVIELMETYGFETLKIDEMKTLEGAKIEKNVTLNFKQRIDSLRNIGK